jgi:enoyl-[acyl-carrier protein] reductase II
MASMPPEICPAPPAAPRAARLDQAVGARHRVPRHRRHPGRRDELGQRAHLVAAISNAGGFGVIACGAMPPALLAKEIAATQALTDKPFGVNLITMHPQLDDLVQVCLEAKVGHIVLAGGIPPGLPCAR